MWPFDLFWGWTSDDAVTSFPLHVQDASAARYGVQDLSAARYGVQDLSAPRYTVTTDV